MLDIINNQDSQEELALEQTNKIELSKRNVRNSVIDALEKSELSKDFKTIVYNRLSLFLWNDILQLVDSMTIEELVESYPFLHPDFELRRNMVWLDPVVFDVKNLEKKLEKAIKNYALYYFANDEIQKWFNWLWKLIDWKRGWEYLVSLINQFWKIDNGYFIQISRESISNNLKD